jgi:hypothetical protein
MFISRRDVKPVRSWFARTSIAGSMLCLTHTALGQAPGTAVYETDPRLVAIEVTFARAAYAAAAAHELPWDGNTRAQA